MKSVWFDFWLDFMRAIILAVSWWILSGKDSYTLMPMTSICIISLSYIRSICK
jgi:hypothetical protein